MDVEDAIDELYRVPPDRFVERRDELVARFRESGDTESAGRIAARRKPTIAAWALDQLAHRHPDELRRFLDAADAAQRAQRGAGTGTGPDLREAMSELRSQVGRLADVAAGIAGEVADRPEAHRDDITSTLQAAAADPATCEQLVAGRLRRAVPTRGLAGLAAAVPDGAGDGQRTDQQQRRARLQRRRRELEARIRTLEQRVQRQRDRAERAARRARDLRLRAQEAEEQATEERRQVDARSEELDGVRSELEEVRERLSGR